METQREIEAITIENLVRQREIIDHKIAEIESKREEKEESVDGYFDGESFIGDDGRIYPIPANYVSKSLLIDGDKLRLYFVNMVYKQIGLVPRKTIFATYVGQTIVEGRNGMSYNVIKSSVSYFKLEVGSEVICDICDEPASKFAAIKGVVKRV